MKSNIQRRKEELRAFYKLNNCLPTCDNSYDYIGYELKEKDEEGNNYFVHIDSNSDEEEIREFFAISVKDILNIQEWYAGFNGGCEYTTDKDRYSEETRNTFRIRK